MYDLKIENWTKSYSSIETSNKRYDNKDVVDLCLMAKNRKKEVSDDEYYLLTIYDQLEYAFEEFG